MSGQLVRRLILSGGQYWPWEAEAEAEAAVVEMMLGDRNDKKDRKILAKEAEERAMQSNGWRKRNTWAFDAIRATCEDTKGGKMVKVEAER